MFHRVLKYVIWGWTQGGLFVLQSNQRWQVLDLHWPPTAICQRSDVDWSRRWTWAVQTEPVLTQYRLLLMPPRGNFWLDRWCLFTSCKTQVFAGLKQYQLGASRLDVCVQTRREDVGLRKGWSYPETPSRHIQIQLFLLRFFFFSFLFKESKL